MTDKPAVVKPSIGFGKQGLELRNIEDMYRFAKYAVESKMTQKGITTAEQALIVIQYGAELGFNPMRALAAINIIENLPSLKSEAVLALIRTSGMCNYGPEVGNEGEGDERIGFVLFQRREQKAPVKVTFSVREAKLAGLWGKRNWVGYPDDMLVARAVGRTGRRYFSDILLGIGVAEEVRDFVNTTATVIPPEVLQVTDPLLEAGLDEANRLLAESVGDPTSAADAVPRAVPSTTEGPTTAAVAPSTGVATSSVTPVEGNADSTEPCDDCGRMPADGHRINCSKRKDT